MRFTIHDVVSRWSEPIANPATNLLDIIKRRIPFTVKAIQVDGGSEFSAIFEEE